MLSHGDRAKRRKDISKALEKGISVSEVAKNFGVCISTVEISAKENSVVPVRDSRIQTIKPTTFLILKKLLEGQGLQEIASEFGISRQSVHQTRLKAEEAGFTFPDLLKGRRPK